MKNCVMVWKLKASSVKKLSTVINFLYITYQFQKTKKIGLLVVSASICVC